jgi:hypothetical protein
VQQWHSDKTAKTRFRQFWHYPLGVYQDFFGQGWMPGVLGFGWGIATSTGATKVFYCCEQKLIEKY